LSDLPATGPRADRRRAAISSIGNAGVPPPEHPQPAAPNRSKGYASASVDRRSDGGSAPKAAAPAGAIAATIASSTGRTGSQLRLLQAARVGDLHEICGRRIFLRRTVPERTGLVGLVIKVSLPDERPQRVYGHRDQEYKREKRHSDGRQAGPRLTCRRSRRRLCATLRPAPRLSS